MKLFKEKERKGLTFEEIAKKKGRNLVWVASLFYRQSTASREEIEKFGELLDLYVELMKEFMKTSQRRSVRMVRMVVGC